MKKLNNKNPKIGLALCGGGEKGIIQIAIIREIERRLPKPISHYLDYIAGVSAGAINGVYLSTGEKSASEIINFYLYSGKDIFNKKPFRFGLFKPKYDRVQLDTLLDKHFADKKMSDLVCKTMVLSVPITNDKNYRLFKSYKPIDEDLYLKDIVGASASAPTYFPAKEMSEAVFIDGGMCQNNPSIILLSEMIKLEGDENNVIISIGCGYKDEFAGKKAKSWGSVGWVTKLFDVILASNSKMVHKSMETLASSNMNLRYFRLTPELFSSSGAMDDASNTNHMNMLADVDCFLSDPEVEAKITEIANILKSKA